MGCNVPSRCRMIETGIGVPPIRPKFSHSRRQDHGSRPTSGSASPSCCVIVARHHRGNLNRCVCRSIVFSSISVDLLCEQQKVERCVLVGVEVASRSARNCGTMSLMATDYRRICDAICNKQSKTRKIWRVLQLCIIEAGSIRVRWRHNGC